MKSDLIDAISDDETADEDIKKLKEAVVAKRKTPATKPVVKADTAPEAIFYY